MNNTLKEHLANLISISFLENLPEDLKQKIFSGEIKSIKFEMAKNVEEPSLKCVTEEISFVFPLKPTFLKKLEEQKKSVITSSKKTRKIED